MEEPESEPAEEAVEEHIDQPLGLSEEAAPQIALTAPWMERKMERHNDSLPEKRRWQREERWRDTRTRPEHRNRVEIERRWNDLDPDCVLWSKASS